LGNFISFVAVNNFLKKNGLVSLIRAHEAQFEGFKAYVWQNTDFPQVVTLFSAPNYCGCYANKGAIIKLIVA
jgi:serine/threonine-protein phosphatase 2B catalytic subunit